MQQEHADAERQRPQRRQPHRRRLLVDRPQGSQSRRRQSGEGDAGARFACRRQGRQGELRPDRGLPDELRRHVGARAHRSPAPNCSAPISPGQTSPARTSRRPNSGASISARRPSPAPHSRWPTCRGRRLRGTTFEGPIDFTDAFLFLARLEGLDLSKATGLEQMQIDLACGDAKTKLPAGLKAPATWPCKFEDD